MRFHVPFDTPILAGGEAAQLLISMCPSVTLDCERHYVSTVEHRVCCKEHFEKV